MQLSTGAIPLITDAVLYRAIFTGAELQESPSVEGLGRWEDVRIHTRWKDGSAGLGPRLQDGPVASLEGLCYGTVHRGCEDGRCLVRGSSSFHRRADHILSSKGFSRKDSLMKLSSLGVVVIDLAVSDFSSPTRAKKASAS